MVKVEAGIKQINNESARICLAIPYKGKTYSCYILEEVAMVVIFNSGELDEEDKNSISNIIKDYFAYFKKDEFNYLSQFGGKISISTIRNKYSKYRVIFEDGEVRPVAISKENIGYKKKITLTSTFSFNGSPTPLYYENDAMIYPFNSLVSLVVTRVKSSNVFKYAYKLVQNSSMDPKDGYLIDVRVKRMLEDDMIRRRFNKIELRKEYIQAFGEV